MLANVLKQGDEKNDLILACSSRIKNRVWGNALRVEDSLIFPSTNSDHLSVIFDAEMNSQMHSWKMCQLSFMHLRNIAFIMQICSRRRKVKSIISYTRSSHQDLTTVIVYTITATTTAAAAAAAAVTFLMPQQPSPGHSRALVWCSWSLDPFIVKPSQPTHPPPGSIQPSCHSAYNT